MERNKNDYLLFSQVQSFKDGSANLLRSECIDTESEGDDSFKIINLHIVFVRQSDGTFYVVFPQNSTLAKSLYTTRIVGAITPNSSQSSHSVMAMEPVLVGRVVMMLRFSFICILLYWLSNGTANDFLHISQLVGQQFQVLTYLLGGYLRVDLRGFYVGMPQQTADGFKGYSVG